MQIMWLENELVNQTPTFESIENIKFRMQTVGHRKLVSCSKYILIDHAKYLFIKATL